MLRLRRTTAHMMTMTPTLLQASETANLVVIVISATITREANNDTQVLQAAAAVAEVTVESVRHQLLSVCLHYKAENSRFAAGGNLANATRSVEPKNCGASHPIAEPWPGFKHTQTCRSQTPEFSQRMLLNGSQSFSCWGWQICQSICGEIASGSPFLYLSPLKLRQNRQWKRQVRVSTQPPASQTPMSTP